MALLKSRRPFTELGVFKTITRQVAPLLVHEASLFQSPGLNDDTFLYGSIYRTGGCLQFCILLLRPLYVLARFSTHFSHHLNGALGIG
jgi:hypothetical protein